MRLSRSLLGHMSLRQDIVRGLRIGTILLALMLLGYAGYRVMRESPPSGISPVTTAAPAPEPGPRHIPAPVSSPGPSIPPPPPVKSRPQLRTQTVENVAQSAVAPAPEAEIAAPEEVAPEPEKAPDSNTPVVAAEPKLAASPVEGEDPVRPDSRGKKMLKAVGRFLHIGGKKDIQQ